MERTGEGEGSRYVTINQNAGEGATRTIVDLIDMNGDGLADRVMSEWNGTPRWVVQLNNGSGLEAGVDFGLIHEGERTEWRFIRHTNGDGEQLTHLIDMNGDSLPDRVLAYVNNAEWKVQLNTGTGFEAPVSWGPIELRSGDTNERYITLMKVSSVGPHARTMLMDLNGDGLPDRVMTKDEDTEWEVQWNTGTGFTTKELWGPIETVEGVNPKQSYPRFSTLGGREYCGYGGFEWRWACGSGDYEIGRKPVACAV